MASSTMKFDAHNFYISDMPAALVLSSIRVSTAFLSCCICKILLLFSVLAAEVIKHFLPKSIDIHNYTSASSTPQKMQNWHLLNRWFISHLIYRFCLSVFYKDVLLSNFKCKNVICVEREIIFIEKDLVIFLQLFHFSDTFYLLIFITEIEMIRLNYSIWKYGIIFTFT